MLKHNSDVNFIKIFTKFGKNWGPGRPKLIKIDDQGRLDFSRKALLEKPEGYVERPKRPRQNGGRGGKRPFKKRRF